MFKSVMIVTVTGSGWWQNFDWMKWAQCLNLWPSCPRLVWWWNFHRMKWMQCLNLWPSCQWLVWCWNFQSAGPATRFQGGRCVQHLRHPCFFCAVGRYATLWFRGAPRLVLILFIPINLRMEEDRALRKWSSLWTASCVVPASLLPFAWVQVQCCFTSTKTVRLIRDREPSTATSSFCTAPELCLSDCPVLLLA